MVLLSFRQNDRTSLDLLPAAPDAQGNGSLQRDLAYVERCATADEQRGARLEEISEIFRVRNFLCGSNAVRLGSTIICHVANYESQNRHCQGDC